MTTLDELRSLIDGLDDFVRAPAGFARLRKVVLDLAMTGQLVPQLPYDGSAADLVSVLEVKRSVAIRGRRHHSKALARESTAGLYAIPPTWQYVSLGLLGDFGSGSTPERGNPQYYGGDINWFKSGELTDWVLDVDSVEKITEEALRRCSLRLNRPGDLLIAMYGATAGKLALLERPGTTNQAVCGCTLDSEIDRMFIFYALLATRDTLIAKSAGAAQPNISKEKIIAHQVPLPPSREQQRIAVKVGEAFALIKRLEDAYVEEERQRNVLKEAAFRRLGRARDSFALDHIYDLVRIVEDVRSIDRAIIELAVSGSLVQQRSSEGTGRELLERVLASRGIVARPDAGRQVDWANLPDSWAPCLLGEVVELCYGKGLDKVRRDDRGQYIAYGANGPIARTDDWLVEGAGIVVGRKGSAGAVNIVSGPFWPTDVTYFVPDEQFGAFCLSYLACLLRSLDLPSLAGGIKPGLNRREVYQLAIGLPPLGEQHRIVRKVDELLALTRVLRDRLAA